MKIKLKIQVRLPFENEFLPAGTIMDVQDDRGRYFICSNDQVGAVFIQKENVEVVKDERS